MRHWQDDVWTWLRPFVEGNWDGECIYHAYTCDLHRYIYNRGRFGLWRHLWRHVEGWSISMCSLGSEDMRLEYQSLNRFYFSHRELTKRLCASTDGIAFWESMTSEWSLSVLWSNRRKWVSIEVFTLKDRKHRLIKRWPEKMDRIMFFFAQSGRICTRRHFSFHVGSITIDNINYVGLCVCLYKAFQEPFSDPNQTFLTFNL